MSILYHLADIRDARIYVRKVPIAVINAHITDLEGKGFDLYYERVPDTP